MISAQTSKAESAADKVRRDVQKSLQDERLFPELAAAKVYLKQL